MATLEALYLQDPFWIWLAAACLFVSLTLATGCNLLMWPAASASLVAVVELLGLRFGLGLEAAAFAVLALGPVGAVLAGTGPRAVVFAGAPEPRRVDEVSSGLPGQTGRLIGRIGRTTGEFINGVGRVWIDGAEWAAELDSGEEVLPEGVPVRVVPVIGGVRLQIHPLTRA